MTDISSPLKVRAKPSGRFQIGVRALIALVGCCGVVLWAWRYVRENFDPMIAEARGIQDRALRALQSTKATERVSAIRALSRLGFGDSGIAIRPLITRLADDDAEVRAAAADALGSIGSEAVNRGFRGDGVRAAANALLVSLKDQQHAVRLTAANALGMIAGGWRAAELLDLNAVVAGLTAGLGDRDAQVRGAILHALAAAARSAPVGPPAELIAVLEDESAHNRTEAATALGSFTRGLDVFIPTLLMRLEDARGEVREAYSQALHSVHGSYRPGPIAYSDAAMPALVAALGSRDERVRYHAVSLLGGLGRGALEAVPELIGILRQPNKRAYQQFDATQTAMEVLGMIAPDTEYADAVIAALSDIVASGNVPEQSRAADALGKFGTEAEAAIPVLIKAFRAITGKAPAYRYVGGGGVQSLASALGRLAPGTALEDEAVTALIEALESKSGEIRLWAIRTLPRFGRKAESAIPLLREFQQGPRDFISEAARAALKSLEAAD
jgi:HEAT repeat protein